MSDSSSFTLEEYKIQREYRDQKRKQYLKRFQNLRANMGLTQTSTMISQNIAPPKKVQVQPIQPVQSVQQPSQIKLSNHDSQVDRRENEQLRKELAELEQQQRKKLAAFKSKIETVKGKYIQKIKSISEQSTAQKDENQGKIAKLENQIKNASSKNVEIQNVNQQLQSDLTQGDNLMEKYSEQINKQYSAKLEDFQKIFESSNQKIEAMEKQYNEEQFVQNTLKNEELIETIRQNSQRADQDIDKIISDYQQLLEGKSEILNELTQNNEMKEKQIAKMGELQEKLKSIFQKLNEEKKMYMAQNSKMAEQLMEVKNLLMSTMGQVEE